MQNQTPLPFPEPETPADPPKPAVPVGGAGPDAGDPVAPDPTEAASPDPAVPAPEAPRGPRTPLIVSRPLWAKLLGKVLEPWIELKLEPQTPAQFDDGRPVCYVLEDYGISNALILDRACQEAGLPSPLTPLPGDPLGRKRAYVALSRRNANSTLGLAADMAVDLATGKPPKMARPARRHRHWRQLTGATPGAAPVSAGRR